jgi:hypothetical protein
VKTGEGMMYEEAKLAIVQRKYSFEIERIYIYLNTYANPRNSMTLITVISLFWRIEWYQQDIHRYRRGYSLM